MDQYDLELSKVIERIKKDNPKMVCVQLPDGLKPKAAEIQESIEKTQDPLLSSGWAHASAHATFLCRLKD